MKSYQTTFSIKRLWIILSVGMVVMFGILLLLGQQIYQQAPPIPEAVKSQSGETLFTRADIETELDRGLPAQATQRVTAPVCLFPAANLSGTFDTTFDTLDLEAITEERATLTWSAFPPAVNLPQSFDAVAGFDPEQMGAPTVRVLGIRPSGQVLVLQDMLGMNPGFKPKFLKTYLNGAELVTNALNTYDREVKEGLFPTEKESYS